MQHKRLQSQSGASLIEQMLSTCLAGLLVVLSLPGLEQAKDKRRLESAVAQVETELQFARSEAVARSQTVRVAFVSSAGGMCYVIHAGSPRQCSCDAEGRSVCSSGAEVLRSAFHPLSGGVQVASSATEIGFDATHGTVTPTTTLRFQNRQGDRLNVVINLVGRIRSCSPSTVINGRASC